MGLSELQREHDDLDAAAQRLLASKELGEQAALPEHRYRWYVAEARIREVQGDLDGAFDLLHEAGQITSTLLIPASRASNSAMPTPWIVFPNPMSSASTARPAPTAKAMPSNW